MRDGSMGELVIARKGGFREYVRPDRIMVVRQMFFGELRVHL